MSRNIENIHSLSGFLPFKLKSLLIHWNRQICIIIIYNINMLIIYTVHTYCIYLEELDVVAII